MYLTPLQTLGIIFAVAAGTQITRFLPFFVFPENKPVPEFVLYLGRAIPGAVMGLLVVFCLKGVSLLAFPYGIPEAIGIAVTAGLQFWRKNVLVSIAAGTAVYMLLVQVVFA